MSPRDFFPVPSALSAARSCDIEGTLLLSGMAKRSLALWLPRNLPWLTQYMPRVVVKPRYSRIDIILFLCSNLTEEKTKNIIIVTE